LGPGRILKATSNLEQRGKKKKPLAAGHAREILKSQSAEIP